ncbi:hypothetical protein ABZ348_29250 [Streptomyces sp. NPDC005963]|uniref:hypothetical protein n=1 Tax=Streptomyces sp. NPDC005963 TaxID=3156721 RepID=UPI0033D8396B
MILPEWVAAVVEIEFDEVQRSKIAKAIEAMKASEFHPESPEVPGEMVAGNARLVGAIVDYCRESYDLDETLEMGISDWRDLLLGTGLEHEDWARVLVEKLGGPTDVDLLSALSLQPRALRIRNP